MTATIKHLLTPQPLRTKKLSLRKGGNRETEKQRKKINQTYRRTQSIPRQLHLQPKIALQQTLRQLPIINTNQSHILSIYLPFIYLDA